MKRPQKPPPTFSIEKTLSRIPGMGPEASAMIWANANRWLADPSKRNKHDDARRIMRAINAEWERLRQLQLRDPESFIWPNTDASRGDGSLDATGWEKEGALKFMGYRVGNVAGEPSPVRQRLLIGIFESVIPPAFRVAYLNEWGEPSSVKRLRKMAEALAAFTRNAKRRRNHSMATAVRDWEHDLDFLYRTYYVGKFHFAWPKISDE